MKSELAYDARVVVRMIVLCIQYVGARSYLSFFRCYKLCGTTQAWVEHVSSS